MIRSISPELEEKIRAAREQDSEETVLNVFDSMAMCVAANEVWLVPARFVTDSSDDKDSMPESDTGEETADGSAKDSHTEDKDEGIFVKGLENIQILHGYKVHDGIEYPLLTAFTSRDQLDHSKYDIPPMTVSIKAKDILELALAREEVVSLSLNPGCDRFDFEKESLPVILEQAKRITEREINGKIAYVVDPKSVIDTDAIIADWQAGWTDEGNIENWKLKAYPVMADGTVLLIFEMSDEIYDGADGHLYCSHKEMHYRILHYDLSGEPKLLNKYRFKTQDGDLFTCFIRDGILYSVMSTRFSYKYTVLQSYPNNDDAQFSVFSYVEKFIARSDGTLIAGYSDNTRDDKHAPVVFFDPSGNPKDSYREKNVLGCRGLTLDKNENVWTYLCPSNCLYVFDEENHEVHEIEVALQGFDDFGLTDDYSKLIVSFDGYDDESILYVMRRLDDFRFVDPVLFDFSPKDRDGNDLTASDCDYFGCPSIMKNTMILRADGMLYVYDLNDFCDDSRDNQYVAHEEPEQIPARNDSKDGTEQPDDNETDNDERATDKENDCSSAKAVVPAEKDIPVNEELLAGRANIEKVAADMTCERPLTKVQMDGLKALIDRMNSGSLDEISLKFSNYLDDDTVDRMRIRKSDNGYFVSFEFNMADFGWNEPLLLGRDDLSEDELKQILKQFCREGKATDDIKIIINSFRNIKE